MTANFTSEIVHEIWASAQLSPGEGIEDGVDRIAKILSERTSQPAVSVAKGWKLVPVEPTDDMKIVGGDYDAGDSYYESNPIGEDGAAEVYKSMIAAAPTTPTEGGENG
jgi:hypothetical protein